MSTYQITCIRRDGRDADRRIDRLGGIRPDGGGWNDTIDAVIQSIETGHRFWTTALGKAVWVEVRRHPVSGRKYLATENDGFPPNNLLSLPECP
ncbi:MAG: DUF3892 domain-containing protein [Sphingorhabdus sp.]|uniref:DUF3892 domain-containing protein n=1 Tax=Sphingorhabdus sp. TaxID=1902408 RepID=UPI0034599C62|nr:DUF3892 domain-containing protein [Sphingorhabdus sp.]